MSIFSFPPPDGERKVEGRKREKEKRKGGMRGEELKK